MVAGTLAGQLEQARLIPRDADLCVILGWLIVPLAVTAWHRARKPPPPPPATPARRALTRAATALTLAIAAAGTITVWTLIYRHDLTLWSLSTPGIFAVLPVQAACFARDRNRPAPPPGSTARARHVGQETPRYITREQAARRASDIRGVPAGDPQGGWELIDFPADWLIWPRDRGRESDQDSGSVVIERETGHVIRFGPGVPPQRIVGAYEEARQHGRPDHRWPALPLTTAAPPLPEFGH
jgi:hypothetical protein